MGLEVREDWEDATRYARPWRPVKPLEIICEHWARSLKQRAQRRWDAVLERYESGPEGLLEGLGDVEVDSVLSVLDCLLRKDEEGARKVAKRGDGDGRVGEDIVTSALTIAVDQLGVGVIQNY